MLPAEGDIVRFPYFDDNGRKLTGEQLRAIETTTPAMEHVFAAVAALYRRVSTDKQADDGYSNGSLDRPGMKGMIENMEAGTVTHVIVVELDRPS